MTQFTLRGNTAHVQIGGSGDYAKADFPASDALKAYYHAQVAAGNSGNSFADTSTQYVPCEVTEKVSRVLRVTVPATVIEVEG